MADWLKAHDFDPALAPLLFEAGIETPKDFEYVVLGDLQDVLDQQTVSAIVPVETEDDDDDDANDDDSAHDDEL